MNNYNCYIHIPFCRSKCKYCRFASFSILDELKIQNYVDFLCGEIEGSCKYDDKDTLKTVYFGGGTPTTLSQKQFERIFQTLRQRFNFSDDIEISIESTPEAISFKKLQYLTNLGMTRLSMGVQTLNKKTLEEVKRDKKGDILEKLEIIKEFLKLQEQTLSTGFSEQISFSVKKNEKSKNNLSILDEGGNNVILNRSGLKSVSLDFIIGLPFVKKGEILENISYIIKNYPFVNHISVYMLEDYYDPGDSEDKFEQITYPENWEKNSICEKDIGEEYLKIKKYLEENGFLHYELSNFAKKGYTCKHNVGYWNHAETFAFGLGASGFLENTRYKNSEDFLEYYSGKGKESEILEKEDIFLEKIMFLLRTTGIGKELAVRLQSKKVNYFIENGYLEKKADKIILTDTGTLYLDYILSEIL